MQAVSRFDPTKLEPHSSEAEQQLIGAVLLNNQHLDKISGIIGPSDFYDPVHQAVWQSIVDRYSEGAVASPVTLAPMFQEHEGMRELGGPSYLVKMAGASASSFAVTDYARLIRDLSAKRELMAYLRDARDEIAKGERSSSAIALDLETKSGSVAATAGVKPMTTSYLHMVTAAAQQMSDASSGASKRLIPTGLPALDRRLGGGLSGGQMILLAGRPGMGKTTIGMSICHHMLTQNIGCFFASLEMPEAQCGGRFLSRAVADQGIRIPYRDIRSGELTEADARAVLEQAKANEAFPMRIAERDVREMNRLRSAIRRTKQEWDNTPIPLGVIFIDYLQLIEVAKARGSYEIANAAADFCKSLAVEFDVPVVAMSQLSRGVEQRDPPVPMMSDLRDSGKLEENADVVIMAYRPAYYIQQKLDQITAGADVPEEKDELKSALHHQRDNLDLIVAKQRDGPTGTERVYVDIATGCVTGDRSHPIFNNGEMLL
jgi:replicative DNA helicase